MLVCLILSAGACGGPVATPSIPTATQRGGLTPYWTPAPSRTSTPFSRQITPPVTPAPTPTPFLHTITADDTLLAIAYRYGISLDSLVAANPGVDAHLLLPGNTLIIPISADATASPASPTPITASADAPYCYPVADGGLWCFLLVTNNQPFDLENLSAWIGLYSIDGDAAASQVAIPPLNLLPSGQTIPLTAYFAPPLPEQVFPQGELLTALAVIPDPTRYLTATAAIEQTDISADGLQATVQGVVTMAENSPAAHLIWVAAVGYDADGRAVGVRKWEASVPDSEGGWQSLAFNMTVFSLGPRIARVEVLVEARP